MISFLCALALTVGRLPLAPLETQTALTLDLHEAYQVGYAWVDINPYVVEDDPSSGIMTLPFEPFDFYFKDTTLTGDARTAPENNLWGDLVGDTYGRPFVLGYSIGAYCASMAKGTDAMADLANATAVYGYHAKQYFG